MSNEQCCLCGAVGHDSKDCKMYSVKVKGIHAVKGHAVPVEYAAGWDAALDAVQAARAQPAATPSLSPHDQWLIDQIRTNAEFAREYVRETHGTAQPAGEAAALDVEMTFKLLRNHGMTTGCANLTIDILNNWLAQRTAPPAQVPDGWIELAKNIVDCQELVDRIGASCEFEGQGMIYVSWLDEWAGKARALLAKGDV